MMNSSACTTPVHVRRSGKLVAISRDITGRRQARLEREHLLREVQAANERMNEVFKHAPAFMCILRGPDHVCETVNDRYCQLVGGRRIVGLPAREALPGVAGQGLFELHDQVCRTGETFIGNKLRGHYGDRHRGRHRGRHSAACQAGGAEYRAGAAGRGAPAPAPKRERPQRRTGAAFFTPTN
jgi:PAS domain-containing protein